MNTRKIYAEINVDEDTMSRNTEANGYYDDGPISNLEREFGWLDGTGFSLGYAMIADDDEDDDYAAYRNYLVDFAFAAHYDDGSHSSPLSYEDWLESNKNN